MSTMLNPLDKTDRKDMTFIDRVAMMLMWLAIVFISLWAVAAFIRWFRGLSPRKQTRTIILIVASYCAFVSIKKAFENPIDNPEKYTPKEVYEARRAQREKDMREDPEHWQDQYFGMIP